MYFSTGTRYFVYPCGTECKSLIFKISQDLSYFLGGFECCTYSVSCRYSPFIYRRMEKVFLPVTSCDGCVLRFIVLLVCLLIILLCTSELIANCFCTEWWCDSTCKYLSVCIDFLYT